MHLIFLRYSDDQPGFDHQLKKDVHPFDKPCKLLDVHILPRMYSININKNEGKISFVLADRPPTPKFECMFFTLPISCFYSKIFCIATKNLMSCVAEAYKNYMYIYEQFAVTAHYYVSCELF